MPEITRFMGTVIKMYFAREHNPPHFHVIYNDYTGSIDINTLEMIEGDIPNRVYKLVREWAAKYQKELMQMWNEKRIIELPPLL